MSQGFRQYASLLQLSIGELNANAIARPAQPGAEPAEAQRAKLGAGRARRRRRGIPSWSGKS